MTILSVLLTCCFIPSDQTLRFVDWHSLVNLVYSSTLHGKAALEQPALIIFRMFRCSQLTQTLQCRLEMLSERSIQWMTWGQPQGACSQWGCHYRTGGLHGLSSKPTPLTFPALSLSHILTHKVFTTLFNKPEGLWQWHPRRMKRVRVLQLLFLQWIRG